MAPSTIAPWDAADQRVDRRQEGVCPTKEQAAGVRHLHEGIPGGCASLREEDRAGPRQRDPIPPDYAKVQDEANSNSTQLQGLSAAQDDRLKPVIRRWSPSLEDTEKGDSDGTASMQPTMPLRTRTPGDDDETPLGCEWQDLLSEGFEGSWRWETFGDPTWGNTSYRRYSGSRSAWCAEDGLNAPGPYAPNMVSWMVYGPFDLRNAYDAIASFRYWLDSEDNNHAYDKLAWMASRDGNYFEGYYDSGQYRSWQSGVLDLSGYVGDASVWFAFYFESDASVQYEGAYVDAVTIEACIAGRCTSCPSYDETIVATTSWRTDSGDVPAGGCQMYRMFPYEIGDYTVKTGCGDGATANFNTIIEVYDSGCSLVASNDNGCESNRSIVTWTPNQSAYYYIKIRGSGGAGGNYTLAYRLVQPSPGHLTISANRTIMAPYDLFRMTATVTDNEGRPLVGYDGISLDDPVQLQCIPFPPTGGDGSSTIEYYVPDHPPDGAYVFVVYERTGLAQAYSAYLLRPLGEPWEIQTLSEHARIGNLGPLEDLRSSDILGYLRLPGGQAPISDPEEARQWGSLLADYVANYRDEITSWSTVILLIGVVMCSPECEVGVAVYALATEVVCSATEAAFDTYADYHISDPQERARFKADVNTGALVICTLISPGGEDIAGVASFFADLLESANDYEDAYGFTIIDDQSSRLDGSYTGAAESIGISVYNRDYDLFMTLVTDDIDDFGDDASEADEHALYQTIPGAIQRRSDEDWGYFTASSDACYNLDVTLGTLSRALITLYDTDGRTVLERTMVEGRGGTLTWLAPRDDRFYLSIAGDGSEVGTYGIGIGPGWRLNDSCSGAFGPLSVPSVTEGSTTCSSIDYGIDACGGGTVVVAPGVWYSVVGTGGQMTVATCDGTEFDTKISVFRGECSDLDPDQA